VISGKYLDNATKPELEKGMKEGRKEERLYQYGFAILEDIPAQNHP
jgi:hypothetical protein